MVTIGKFDGLHVGHQKLLHLVCEKKKDGVKAVVFTFDVPPGAKLSGKGMDTLVTNEERCQMLEEQGIDYLIECPFVPEIMSMEPERFVEEVLVGRLKARYIVAGTDCGFGHKDVYKRQEFDENEEYEESEYPEGYDPEAGYEDAPADGEGYEEQGENEDTEA